MQYQQESFEMLKLFYSNNQGKIYLFLPAMTDYTYLPEHFTSHYHLHPVYHLVFIHDGYGHLEAENGCIALKKEDILLINPMEKHVFVTLDSHLSYFAFNFYLIPINSKENLIDKYISDYYENSKDLGKAVEYRKLEDVISINVNNSLINYNKNSWNAVKMEIEKFRREIQSYINSFRLQLCHDIASCGYINNAVDFFLQMCSKYFTTGFTYDKRDNSNSPIIWKIINYLENNLDKKLKLDTIASELGYNPTYLSSHFSLKMNITISEYFNALKINKACELIKYTNKSITDIAGILGYSSSQHFSNKFKASKMMTPREYRNNTEIY